MLLPASDPVELDIAPVESVTVNLKLGINPAGHVPMGFLQI